MSEDKKIQDAKKAPKKKIEAVEAEVIKQGAKPKAKAGAAEQQISKEEIQKLLLQHMQKQAAAKGGAMPPGMGQPKMNRVQRALTGFVQKVQTLVHMIDRFTNFVIKKEDVDRNEVVQVARPPILFGTAVIFIFVGIGGTWSATAPLDKAAHAMGVVKPASEGQILQHPTGGIVKKIYVKKNDYVKKDQPLLELDAARAKSDYTAAWQQYLNALANEDRLIAQRDLADKVTFDAVLLDNQDKIEVAKIIRSQNQLFEANVKTQENSIKAMEQQIKQIKEKLKNAEFRKVASDRAFAHMQDRYNAMSELAKEGHVSSGQLSEAEAKLEESRAQASAASIEIDSTKHQIIEAEAKLVAQKNDFINRMSEELRKSQLEAAAMREKYLEAKDALDRVVIRSPVEGTVKEFMPTTIGSVIGNNPIGEVTPYDDPLIIEALIPSRNIDSVEVGLKVKIRFMSFKSRTSPVFTGTVVSLSPDALDPQRGAIGPDGKPQGRQYRAIVELDMDEWNKIAKKYNLKLQPGLEADVQIVTGERTLLRYLLDPVLDQAFKAFIEK